MINLEKDRLTLRWDEPESDNGSPIKQYIVEKQETTKPNWLTAGEIDKLEFTVTKLFEDKEYSFRIAAENKVGISKFVQLDNTVKTRSKTQPPSPPRKLKVDNITQSSCKLSWKEPENDGGSPIVGYYVEKLQKGYGSRWLKINRAPFDKTFVEIKDLIEMNEYNFRVIAENKVGLSSPSEKSERVITKSPFNKPSDPGKPKVEIENKESFKIKWTAPKEDGGSEIDHYILEEYSNFRWNIVDEKIKKTEYVFKNTKKSTDYQFKVSAVNKIGQGPFSDESDLIKIGN